MTEERDAINQTQLVKQVYELTKAIEHAAGLADWQRAAELVDERSPLLMSIAAEQEPVALEMIRYIQSVDSATVEQAQRSQAELETEYRAAMDRTRAAGQYHRVALL
ncbi:flagellar protein FliT [Paraburkholderia phenazinium]|uniref:Flagellar protein FliT n=1 Tax=Paraburkholderia phenazinium TaxID=60549 RepID=A0A1G7PWG5_9BURK|nr:flagellar protein FliT [Paraburkholderia phenazinium]SDF90682.1 protein FliT [Paraburkholderia phenazinium]